MSASEQSNAATARFEQNPAGIGSAGILPDGCGRFAVGIVGVLIAVMLFARETFPWWFRLCGRRSVCP